MKTILVSPQDHSRFRWMMAAVCLCLCILPRDVLAVGEQSGRLRGRLVEAATHTPMPGGRIEIHGEALIGGPRFTSSDEQGRFDFIELPPGRYLIRVSYEGLQPMQRRISIALGQSQDLEIAMSVQLAAESRTTIVEERKRLDPDRAATGRVLSAEEQARLPTGRTYQDIVRQINGVVGGPNPVMAGGSLRQNRYLVDGLDITDPATNTSAFDFNFDAIAQIDVQITPMDAQYNALGGVVNLITRTGSERFTADASLYLNHEALSAGAFSGAQQFEGRLIDQSDPRPPVSRYQVNLNVGGPIVRQSMWFYLSAEYQRRVSSVVPGPPLNSQHPAATFNGFFPRLKLTFAPRPRHLLTFSMNTDPKWETNLRQTNSYDASAEYARQRTGVFGVLNYQWFAMDRLIFEVQAGVAFNRSQLSPQNGDSEGSAHSDRATGIIFGAANAYRIQDDQKLRLQLDPTIKWMKRGWLGSHLFKAGLQLQALREYWLFGTPGNLIYTDDTNQTMDQGALVRDPASASLPFACNPLQPQPLPGSTATPCYRIRTYEPAFIQRLTGWGIGGFIQDVWKPVAWLTITPGLRIDYGIYRNTKSEVVQNLLGFGPRLSAALDVTRDGKTLLKLAYGRSNDINTLLLSSYADIGPQERDWSYNRATGRFDRFFGASFGEGGYDVRGRCADGSITFECGNARLSLSPPRSDSIIASIEREVFANVMASITYTFRYLGYQWERIELNARRTLDGGDYASYGDPRRGIVSAYRPMANAFRRYNGLDLAISGAPTQNLFFYLAYTLSFLEGTIEDVVGTEITGAVGWDPPRDLRLSGYLPDDHRHQIKVQSSYRIRGFSTGINLTYLSGAPTTRLYATPIDYVGRYAWRGVDPGSDPNDVRKWTELRSPDYFNVDLRLQYDLNEIVRRGHHLHLIIDLFNVLNLSTPIDPNTLGAGLENRNTPSYGAVTNRQPPLRAQFALRYNY